MKHRLCEVRDYLHHRWRGRSGASFPGCGCCSSPVDWRSFQTVRSWRRPAGEGYKKPNSDLMKESTFTLFHTDLCLNQDDLSAAGIFPAVFTWPCVQCVCSPNSHLLDSETDSDFQYHRGLPSLHCGCGLKRSSGWTVLPDVLCCCKPPQRSNRDSVKPEATVYRLAVLDIQRCFPF